MEIPASDYINKANTRIIPHKFALLQPTTLHEALEYLEKYQGEIKVLAGGTDLLVKMKQAIYRPRYVMTLKQLKELEYIKETQNSYNIGSMTRFIQIEKHEKIARDYPALHEAIKSIAGIQIRYMATIGGNLCNASPAADSAPPLMVLDARLRLASKDSTRTIPITEFFKGPGVTVLKENELLTEIVIPKPPKNSSSAFIKITRVAVDLAKVSVAVFLQIDDENTIKNVKIALGAVAPTPIRARSAEEFLKGKKMTLQIAEETGKIAMKEIKPITDVRSTAKYRRIVSRVIVRDALLKAYSRIKFGD